MDTYTPMRAMIVCANGTGDYTSKGEVIKQLKVLLTKLIEEL